MEAEQIRDHVTPDVTLGQRVLDLLDHGRSDASSDEREAVSAARRLELTYSLLAVVKKGELVGRHDWDCNPVICARCSKPFQLGTPTCASCGGNIRQVVVVPVPAVDVTGWPDGLHGLRSKPIPGMVNLEPVNLELELARIRP